MDATATVGPPPPEHLLAEDLLLILLDDDSGKLDASVHGNADTALAGAVLADLAMGGHVGVREAEKWWATAKVVPIPSAPLPADEILRSALATATEKERRAQDLLLPLARGLRDTLLDRLVGRGLLERQEDRVLGLFPRTRWPAVDSGHEEGVRRALAGALVDGTDPDERTGALICLLHAVDHAHRTVTADGVAPKEVRERAKAIAEDGTWAADAVSDAVQAAMAAAISVTAITTAGAVTAAGS